MQTDKPFDPRAMHRRQFQAVAVESIDRLAAALLELQQKHLELVQKVQAQGEYMADLAVSRDENLKTHGLFVEFDERVTAFRNRTLWQRVRWLATGR